MSETPLSPPPSRRLATTDWLWVGCAAFVGCVLRLLFAERRGFWLDEYYTLHAARLPLDQLVADRLAAGHSPLPFLYAKFFHALVGHGELALRASSALAVAAALIGVAGLAGRLGLRRILWPLLALGVFSPYWMEIGTEFRYMMPLVAVGAFWLWAITAWIHEQSFRHWLAATLAGGLALWLHGSAQFILFSLIVTVVWHGLRLKVSFRQGARLAWPLFCSLLISLPLLFGLRLMAKERSSPGLPDPFELVRNQAGTFFGRGHIAEHLAGPANSMWATLFLCLYVVAAVGAWRMLRRERIATAGTVLAGFLIGFPAGLMIFSLLGDNVQGTLRYSAASSIGVLIVLALGWHEAGRWRAWGIVYRGTLAAIIGFTFSLQALNQGDWHRESIRWLAGHRKSDQPVVTIGKGMNMLAFEYHGFPDDGLLTGINSSTESMAMVMHHLQYALRHSDSGFLFQYRGGDVPVEEALEELRRTGFVLSIREWRPTQNVRILGISRNTEGARRIRELPEMPMPVLTDDPI